MTPRSLLLTLIFSTRVARRLAGVGLGQRVDELEAVAGLLGDEDGAVGLADVESPAASASSTGRGGRIAGRGELADLLVGLVVAALAELIDRAASGRRRGRRRQGGRRSTKRGRAATLAKPSACHPREGGDPVNDAAAERRRPTVAGLPHSESPVVSWVPAFAGMTRWGVPVDRPNETTGVVAMRARESMCANVS